MTERKKPDIEQKDWATRTWEMAQEYFEKYWRTALVVVLAIIVLLLFYQSWRKKATLEEASAWQQLSSLPSASSPYMQPEQRNKIQREVIKSCENLLDEGWDNSATPWVMLKLANTLFSAGQYPEALTIYKQLTKKYPKHHATRFSAPSLAATLETLGQYKEAAAQYTKIAQRRSENSRFWLDVGRTHELAGDRQAAMRAYENVVSSKGKKPDETTRLAEFRLGNLRAGEKLLPPVPPPPIPEETQKPEQPEVEPKNLPELPGLEDDPGKNRKEPKNELPEIEPEDKNGQKSSETQD
ncbi:MAG: tetratricopeptide repeat protein [Planctomycetes bacterium]|nr:tetratricopeptide repeat protein [Planctomycetota bacterium]